MGGVKAGEKNNDSLSLQLQMARVMSHLLTGTTEHAMYGREQGGVAMLLELLGQKGSKYRNHRHVCAFALSNFT